MERRQNWLFSLMVAAAGSVIVFGCLGIAAILGYIPVLQSSANPAAELVAIAAYYDALEQSGARLMAHSGIFDAPVHGATALTCCITCSGQTERVERGC